MPTQSKPSSQISKFSILENYSAGQFLQDLKQQPKLLEEINNEIEQKQHLKEKQILEDMILLSRNNIKTRVLSALLNLQLESENLHLTYRALQILLCKDEDSYNTTLVEQQLSTILLKDITPQIINKAFEEAEKIRQDRIQKIENEHHLKYKIINTFLHFFLEEKSPSKTMQKSHSAPILEQKKARE